MQTQTSNTLHNAIMEADSKDRPPIAERIARVANPVALVAQQQPVYHPQNHPTHYTQNSSTRSQQAATRNRGKAIVKSPQPIYDQEPSMVAEDDETSKDKKIYKPTNNNLQTSSNTSHANQDNSLTIHRNVGYENQRNGNVAGARENVGSSMVQKSGIQYYNCKEFGHVARECQKLKRAKDAAYHREKMLLYDDELEDQELEAPYMYMAQLQEVSPDTADSGPIFDDELVQKVSNDDHYNVFSMESVHPEQSKSVHDTYPIEQDAQNMELECAKVRGCYNDNLALMLSPDSDEVIGLEKESRSKLRDLIRPFDYEKLNNLPFDYEKLNNLYDLFVPQREKSSEQRYFSERSRLSHINVNNGKSKEAFNKQTTLLEKWMDESIPLDKKCQSSIEILKVKTYVNTIITGVELCKQKIANRTYIGYIDPFIQSTIESNFCPVISRINAGLAQLHRCLNEEMVADLRYFNSLELEDLKAQLQDKSIVISELKKLIEKLKGKSVDTKFEKSSVIRQPNAFKSQRPSVLGKPTTSLILLHSTVSNTPLSSNSFVARTDCLFIVDSRCSKHMTGNLKLLINFVEKFLGTVKFGNDQIAPILGYGDLVQGAVTIKKVTSSQAWLWHRRLSHLNFDTINLLSKNDIVVGLPKMKFIKDHLCSSCVLGKAKRKSFHTKLTPSSK
nr:hypothetical protein [Tanacetum cinerariifolium]